MKIKKTKEREEEAEVCLNSIIKYMPLYVEFFDDFIERVRPYAKNKLELQTKIGEAQAAKSMAMAVAYHKRQDFLYFVTDDDCWNIHHAHNNINEYQRSL